MTTHQAPAERSGARDAGEAHNLPLIGRGLAAARLAWLAAAVLVAVLVAVALPGAFVTARAPCASNICYAGQVHVGVAKIFAERGISIEAYGTLIFALQALCALLYFAVAVVIFRRRQDDWMALLGAAMLLLWGVSASTLLQTLDETPLGPLMWAIEALGQVLLTYFFYLFPNGRFVPRWVRWLAPLWLLVIVFQDVLPLVFGYSRGLGRFVSLFTDAWLLSLVATQIYRYRSITSPQQRRQVKWIMLGVAAGVGAFALVDVARLVMVIALSQPGLLLPIARWLIFYALMPLVPLAFGVAILRTQLYDIHIIVNRALVYGALTACVLAIYVLVVGYIGTLLHVEGGGLPLQLLATGLVAVLFQPLRDRLQRGVNRLMYGDRDDPYAVLSRLGQRLEAALAPDAVLPAVAQSVREALNLPYAAISIEQEGEQIVAAESGHPSDKVIRRQGDKETFISSSSPPLVSLSLAYQGEMVGQLLLAPRAGETDFNAADRRLLADLARQAGAAIHAVRLTFDLQQARVRLVAAREEERRRLRRDLHDGLGPVLASMALQADTARELVRLDPAEAEALLENLTAQAQNAVVDIRRLVHALRPPALDDLGLVEAIRATIRHFGFWILDAGSSQLPDEETSTQNNLTIALEVPKELPALPAAVEVAAYRIAQEALTNVARHAQARNCTIRLLAADALHVIVEDDGRGLPEGVQAGVGLISMRERASELGGTCTIERGIGGGTLVWARLPLQ